MCSGKREKRNHQEHEKASFFSSTWVFLYCFWEYVWFTSYVACYFCVVPVGKHSNGRSKMFYKIDALKNLAIFTGKNLCWRFFLIINFIKKRLQDRCFPVNNGKCLSTAFYMEHLPFIILFRIFMWWQVYLDVFGYKIDIFLKALLLLRNQVFSLKIWNFWRAATILQFNIFCWNFPPVFYLPMSTKGCIGFSLISFRSWVICKNLKRPGFYTLLS